MNSVILFHGDYYPLIFDIFELYLNTEISKIGFHNNQIIFLFEF